MPKVDEQKREIMKNSKIILSCLISIMLATSASAAWVPLTGNPVPISSLPDRTLIFGDKKLSEIYVFGSGTGGAIAPDVNSVFVQGGQDNVTGNYGLWFLLSWNAFSGQNINATLNFKISILPGYDNYFIKDIEMDITGSSATGTGGVAVGETVWDAPFPEGNIIASLSCSKQANDGGADLVDYAEFAPLKEIWIFSKDISITGGTDGSAHLSGLFQFYSQIVPEPATMALLGLGSLVMLRRRKAQCD
jgi:hypothetical protein